LKKKIVTKLEKTLALKTTVENLSVHGPLRLVALPRRPVIPLRLKKREVIVLLASPLSLCLPCLLFLLDFLRVVCIG
jgi:hypothetical protein